MQAPFNPPLLLHKPPRKTQARTQTSTTQWISPPGPLHSPFDPLGHLGFRVEGLTVKGFNSQG